MTFVIIIWPAITVTKANRGTGCAATYRSVALSPMVDAAVVLAGGAAPSCVSSCVSARFRCPVPRPVLLGRVDAVIAATAKAVIEITKGPARGSIPSISPRRAPGSVKLGA